MIQKKQNVSMLFMFFSILFCVCLILANLLETKQIALGPISLTGGLIVFPISYIINDCVCEVWGFRKARLLIWGGFAMNFFFVAPRITAASFIAFLVGSFVNAYVMSKMKIRDGGRHFSARAILSTVAGESCDSLFFFPLALSGVVPSDELPVLILSQIFLKTAYEFVALPLTIRVVKYVKQYEGTDAYDDGINYSVWKIFSVNHD